MSIVVKAVVNSVALIIAIFALRPLLQRSQSTLIFAIYAYWKTFEIFVIPFIDLSSISKQSNNIIFHVKTSTTSSNYLPDEDLTHNIAFEQKTATYMLVLLWTFFGISTVLRFYFTFLIFGYYKRI